MIQVNDAHFDYLAVQKGKLQPLAADRKRWDAAYQAAIKEDFQTLYSALPRRCDSILDIGSGLGGIDVLLARSYGARASHPHFCLVDGVDDPPVMTLHRETFSNRAVALDFLRVNGVEDVEYLGPDVFRAEKPTRTFDLVLSLGAWCFHTPPELYLEAVKRRVHRDSILILDVRKDKPEWRKHLEETWHLVGTCRYAAKFDRLAFDAN